VYLSVTHSYKGAEAILVEGNGNFGNFAELHVETNVAVI